jgi:hypothetical protein
MYEWINIITVIASIATIIGTIIAARHYYTQQCISRRRLIAEVLNEVVVPLLNEIKRYESKCQYYVGRVDVSTTTIDVKNYARSEILHRRFVALLKKYHYYEEFQREIDEFNRVQLDLEKKVDALNSTLANMLQGDKRVQVLWEEKVKKAYPDWEYTKAQNAIIREFISSWCYGRSGGIWYILGEDLWEEYCDKVKDILNEIDGLIEKRKQIAQKLEEMLKKVLDKAVEDYSIPDSELRRERFEIV